MLQYSLSLYQSIYLSGINFSIHYICVCITVPAPTVVVTNTTVLRGSDGFLACAVIAVNDNPQDLSINIVWSPNTGIVFYTLSNINVFTSGYAFFDVAFDDTGIYTCTANISHTSEYVLTSGNGSGKGSLFVTG